MRTLETRYALALLDLTQDEAGLEKAAGLLTGDAALWQALNNPCIPGKEKDRVLCRLLEGTVGKELLSFSGCCAPGSAWPCCPPSRGAITS